MSQNTQNCQKTFIFRHLWVQNILRIDHWKLKFVLQVHLTFVGSSQKFRLTKKLKVSCKNGQELKFFLIFASFSPLACPNNSSSVSGHSPRQTRLPWWASRQCPRPKWCPSNSQWVLALPNRTPLHLPNPRTHLARWIRAWRIWIYLRIHSAE